MEIPVYFTKSAEADLDAILSFIAPDNPVRAFSFIDELRQRILDTLATVPDAGLRAGGCRYFVFGNYIALYKHRRDEPAVYVVMICERHRDWRAQLGRLDADK